MSPGCRYLAAALFLADMLVVCLCKGRYKGLLSADNIKLMLANTHNDADAHNDKVVIEVLGEPYQIIIYSSSELS